MPKLTSRGRITIPIKVRSALGVRPGDAVEFFEIEKGQFAIRAVNRSMHKEKAPVRGGLEKPISIRKMNSPIARGTRARPARLPGK
jgi:AbrB family looped-hinge helix DNA binding protein